MSENISTRIYTLKDKLIWGLANFGTSIIQGVFATTTVIFYHVYLGLDPFYIGLAATIYAIWNALNDPIFGYISDRTRTKLGRRIPFMRFTAPFLAITFVIFWLVPIDSSQLSIFLWMLIMMALYDTCYTIIGLVYAALLPELSEEDHVRGQFQQFSSLFYLIGVVFGFFIPEILRPEVGSTNLVPFYIGMVIVGIIGAACIVITTYRFKERPEFTIVDKPLGLKASIKYTFKSKAFLIVTAANFMSIFFQQVLLSYMFYLADYVMQVTSLILLAALILGLIAGVFLTNFLSAKFGVVQANQIHLGFGAIFLLLLPFVPEFLIYLCLFVGGIGLAGPLVLTNVLYGQIADEDEIKSGVRREAAFFGTNAMLTKPAQSVAMAMGPAMLALAGFLTGSITQSTSVQFMIKIIIGLLPGIAMVIGVVILLFYPLKGDYLKEVQVKVLEMHGDKQAKLKNT
ncbi:MAG: MFS transporter [Candidatus Lokiarchaeota archaeon]|nr:MFS transporter [Candidatus Lokiarchaeota archaeon]